MEALKRSSGGNEEWLGAIAPASEHAVLPLEGKEIFFQMIFSIYN